MHHAARRAPAVRQCRAFMITAWYKLCQNLARDAIYARAFFHHICSSLKLHSLYLQHAMSCCMKIFTCIKSCFCYSLYANIKVAT